MNPYRIKVTVKNHLLLSAIEANGHKTVASFARAIGVPYTGDLHNLIAMRSAPLLITGEFSSIAKKVMENLGAAPSDLWTEEQLTLKLKGNTAEMSVGTELVQHLLEQRNRANVLASPESSVFAVESAQVIDKMMDALHPREKKCLQLRFYEGNTLKETAKKLSVTPERARQIEARALRKLRNPEQTKLLLDAGVVRQEGHSWEIESCD